MSKTRGLGRGIHTLIPAAGKAVKNDAAPAGDLKELRLECIVPSPWQPRKHFDQDKLAELASSIRSQGLVQPLVVRAKGDTYELVAGERRLRALKSLGWEKAPVVVMNATDAKMRELALVENLQRADLNPLEIAVAYKELAEDSTLTHEAIAERVGVSRAQVTNTLRLLELPEEVKRLVAEGELSAGAARAILAFPDPMAQIRAAKRAVADGLSVREVEKLSRGKAPAEPPKPKSAKPAHVADLEERLRRHFGTKVEVDDRSGGGRIILEYYSVDDAQRLLQRMGLPEE